MRDLFSLEAYAYELPEGLIAQEPAEPRDMSRLLVPGSQGKMEDRHFRDLPDYLHRGDLIVMNDTRVLHARLRGVKEGGSAAVEVLLLRPLAPAWDVWEALVRPGRRLPPGTRVSFGDAALTVEERRNDEGVRLVRFDEDVDVRALLEDIGEAPLPPYIRSSTAPRERYQTVYAREEGSAAAPTAGLHFTPELFRTLEARGIGRAFVTLHVGLGTFRPVHAEDIREHPMHEEFFTLPPETVAAIEETKRRGGRVVAVGTTVVRTLESCADEQGVLRAGNGSTRLFIYPGYRFRVVDLMVTNFHLPKSSLLMLVAAFVGYDRIMEAYRRAVAEEYRFFSFGDAMLLHRRESSAETS